MNEDERKRIVDQMTTSLVDAAKKKPVTNEELMETLESFATEVISPVIDQNFAAVVGALAINDEKFALIEKMFEDYERRLRALEGS